ncbi:MaoC/PaaZ C-terminal domain-containing protein [Nocardia cyriacigeorgica]|uniref:MaoC/PaaZ C-terminal domain-containing protein n=1 Tax=Nocardia cyriacigeorgica TaxID=135487 RepID=UPI0034DB35CB
MKPGCEAADRDRRVDDLTAEAIFASQWDHQPFHLDEKCAQNTFFEGLAASGWQTASITMRLLVTTGLPLATAIIGASIDLTWPTPGPVTSSTSNWKSPTSAPPHPTPAEDSSPPPTTPSTSTGTSASAPPQSSWRSPNPDNLRLLRRGVYRCRCRPHR